jgi:hypothetical protein
MSAPLNFQLVFGVLTSLVIAGAWWYVALRLPFHWILYALAVTATIGTFISFGIIVLVQSHQSLVLLSPLSYLQTLVGVLDAGLYVVFAAWITSGTKPNT